MSNLAADPRKPASIKRRRRVRRNQASTYYRKKSVRGTGAYRKKRTYKAKNAGTHFEPSYGARLGSLVGEGVQSLASVFGLGEYNIQKNSLMGEIDMGTSPPRVMNTSRGEATIFHHREYIGELVSGYGSPTQYNITSYNINPGNPLLFPFLAGIAANFQEWEARGIIVELKTETSDVVATGGFLGSMFCAVDYDSLDIAPSNKIQLENYEYAASVKPSCSLIMPVECKRRNDVLTHLYTAYNGNYNGGDQRLYDLGVLHIGTQGLPATNTPVAEIWISYEIALYKPKISTYGLTFGWYNHYNLSGVTAAEPFNGLQLQSSFISPNNTLNISQSGDIYFPAVAGKWYIDYRVVSSNATALPTAATPTCDYSDFYLGAFSTGTGPQTSNRAASTPASIIASDAAQQTLVLTIDPSDANAGTPHLKLGWSVMPAGTVYGDLVCFYLPPNMTIP
jgi:hypothetical protein